MAIKGKFEESRYHLLETYVESGSKEQLTKQECEYLEILILMNSMRRKYGKEKTLKFFQKSPYSISAYRCRQMFDESINLFYSNEKLDKAAMRALKAEQLEKAADLALAMAKKPADLEVYGKLIKDSALIRQLDKVDPPSIPEELFAKPIKIYDSNPDAIHLPQVDRNKLGARIDKLDIPEKEKARLKREGLVEDVHFEEMLDEIKKDQ